MIEIIGVIMLVCVLGIGYGVNRFYKGEKS